MKYEGQWTNLALFLREQIYFYIAGENPIAAIDMDDLFIQQLDLLCTQPNMGHESGIEGVQKWVAHTNYHFYYEVDADAQMVTVLAVVHAARQFPVKPDKDIFDDPEMIDYWHS